jgi:hypothetical protein
MFKRIVLITILASSILLALVGTPTHTVGAAGSCSTHNLSAYDRNVPWYDVLHRHVIDVYGVTNTSGYFVYYAWGGWHGIQLSSWYLINNNTGARFGVNTWWVWYNPGWQSYYWLYVYPC